LKLADFGWSIYAPDQMRNTFCGTLDYMPPEVMQGMSYDNRIDIWCVGILTFELLAGKPPFERKSATEAYHQLFTGNVISLSLIRLMTIYKEQLTPKFPEHFSEKAKSFIGLLLQYKPEQRISLTEALKHPFLASAN
jgi:serine/threonine protein kinase